MGGPSGSPFFCEIRAGNPPPGLPAEACAIAQMEGIARKSELPVYSKIFP